jgi:hypothetical protein
MQSGYLNYEEEGRRNMSEKDAGWMGSSGAIRFAKYLTLLWTGSSGFCKKSALAKNGVLYQTPGRIQ